MSIDKEALLAKAREVQKNAYAKFSDYYVGAAVLDENGDVHVGCNVENASYPEGICAEANAIGSMVSTGARRIVAIAVVGGVHADNRSHTFAHGAGEVGACTPCGGCRQRISEFADEDTQIIVADDDGTITTYSMEDLLPQWFRVD